MKITKKMIKFYGEKMPKYVIETKNLTKEYNGTYAVKNINMNVERGKIYGLLGKNGAGKTTTMCMLLGLIKPSKGTIKLFGIDAQNKKNKSKIYKKIGSIIETPGFYPQLTGKENLKIFSKIRGDYNPENINKTLKLVNLHNEEKKKFKNYSLGMKQRLGLAEALLHEPELLILDEPINGLDPAGIIEIRDLLTNITKELGMTVFISSHILSEIEILADEIGIINDGQLIKELTKEELKQQTNKKVIIKVDDLNSAENLLIRENGFKKGVNFDIENNEIHLLTDFEKREKINENLIKNNINVNELHLKEENLEKYFMRLIQGGAA